MVSSQSTFPRTLGQPLLREGRNLTLLALGPVSMAAEDLFQASTQPGGLSTPSQRKDNQTRLQEQGVPEDGE